MKKKIPKRHLNFDKWALWLLGGEGAVKIELFDPVG